MAKFRVKTGLIFKDIVEYDDKSISYEHLYFRIFPFSLAPFKWIGFIGHIHEEFNFDENLHYFENTGKVIGRTTLYLSYSGRYDSLPTTEEELASDDKDDLTFLQLSDNSKEGGLVEIGKEEFSSKEENHQYDEDLHIYTRTIQLRLGKEHNKRIYSYLEKSTAKRQNTEKVGSIYNINQQLLAYDDTWAYHVKPHLFSNSEIDSTPIPYMAFMIKTKPFLFGSNGLYCGYHRQIYIKGISRSVSGRFEKWCKERAKRLSLQGTSFSSSIFANPINVWRWIHPDRISFTDEAIIYTRKTMRRDEMAYVPYERVNIFLSTSGLFFGNFEIFGEQNIFPKFSFTRSDISAIKEILTKHHVKIGKGRSWHSSLLFPNNWFGRAPRILNIEKRLIYYPKRLSSKMKKYNGEKTKVAFLEASEIEIVRWYKPLWKLYGTIEITGTSKNIREDQLGKRFYMVIPNFITFKYKFWFFSGSLRKFLKNNTSATFERKYKNADW